MPDELARFGPLGDLSIRADVERRTIDLRLFSWDTPGMTEDGPELIARDADLSATDVASWRLRLDHQDPPIGRGVALDTKSDPIGPVASFLVSRTARGDEGLTLATDGTYGGASVGFIRTPPAEYRSVGRDRVAVRRALDVREVSLTWRPAHEGSAILAIRQQEAQGMSNEETNGGQAPAPIVQTSAPAAPAEGTITTLFQSMEARLTERFAGLEDLARRQATTLEGIPSAPKIPRLTGNLVGRWMRAALAHLDGEKVPDLELRALADVVTTDNLGVVPKNIRSEVLGIIDASRPFLESTREVDPGESGMTQTFPRIEQRPLAGVQSAEKAELASRKTIIGTVDFASKTIGGAGDLSIQLLRRSSPAFLALWLELLGEAYAIEAEDKAVDALLAAAVNAGTGAFDPETFAFGEAFTNAAAVSPSLAMRPDRMWLSTAAYVAMVDARTPSGGGGTPMYPGLVQLDGITVTNQGAGPAGLRIRPVLVPALDDEAVDVVIGPSRGFAWAEDGTFQLQADNVAKAGRDVGLAGIMWFMPIYPAAFTTYALGA